MKTPRADNQYRHKGSKILEIDSSKHDKSQKLKQNITERISERITKMQEVQSFCQRENIHEKLFGSTMPLGGKINMDKSFLPDFKQQY